MCGYLTRQYLVAVVISCADYCGCGISHVFVFLSVVFVFLSDVFFVRCASVVFMSLCQTRCAPPVPSAGAISPSQTVACVEAAAACPCIGVGR